MENNKKRYIHLSKKKIRALKDKSQNKIPCDKPKGLWIAKEKDWINFVDKNSGKETYGNIYKIIIKSPLTKKLKENNQNKVLKVGTVKGLDKFISKYGKEDKIDWLTVSKDFDGILFEPYYKELDSNKYKWYKTLDVPSGCIWNKKAMDIEFIYEHLKPKKIVRFNIENKVENKNLDKLLLS